MQGHRSESIEEVVQFRRALAKKLTTDEVQEYKDAFEVTWELLLEAKASLWFTPVR